MAKGDVTLVNCIGSTGGVVKDFETKEVIQGSYRHSQTVAGTTYSWKCAVAQLTGVVKLVEDEYEGRVFFRMEGIAQSAKQLQDVQAARSAIADMEW
jgi:hypothetical protein